MYTVLVVLTTILISVFFVNLMNYEREGNNSQEAASEWQNTSLTLNFVWNTYFLPSKRLLTNYMHIIYVNCNLLNLTILILKYVPTGLYMYKFLKNIYKTSLERIRQKQLELEDIQLQIEIVNTKLSVRDAEFTERLEQMRIGEERLRGIRAKVRAAVATGRCTSGRKDDQFILELLKDMKYDQILGPQNISSKMEGCKLGYGENVQNESSTPENEGSVYSSLSDGDVKKDCVVKIVKVTNVYKVAFLKHFIKQKRLRRASRLALLKKKADNIRERLEDWQRSLNMVIHTKLNLLSNDLNASEGTSHEAMGDYSTTNINDFSETEDSARNKADFENDDFFNGTDNYEQEVQDLPTNNDYETPPQNYYKNLYSNYQNTDNSPKACQLGLIPEETYVEMAIEDITAPGNSYEGNTLLLK